ncbi:MAG: hypothetical protein P9L89_06470 [Candidatus Celaenobacter polaris]|nr:hypothetical protein [Candidatus Celaenobacter polaris]
MGQTLRLVFISLRPIRQLADQGDNSKDRYKLTVFLKVIFREEFSENTLFMHYPENLHRIFGGIPVIFV